MKRFKEQYQNCKVMVKTAVNQKIEIDTAKANPNDWAKIPEFAFLFEDATQTTPKSAKETKPTPRKEDTPDTKEETTKESSIKVTKAPEDMTLKELRSKFPDITAGSKKDFLKKLAE